MCVYIILYVVAAQLVRSFAYYNTENFRIRPFGGCVLLLPMFICFFILLR